MDRSFLAIAVLLALAAPALSAECARPEPPTMRATRISAAPLPKSATPCTLAGKSFQMDKNGSFPHGALSLTHPAGL